MVKGRRSAYVRALLSCKKGIQGLLSYFKLPLRESEGFLTTALVKLISLAWEKLV